MSLSKEAIDRIAELGEQAETIEVVEIQGVPFTRESLNDARPKTPTAATVQVGSLTGLVDLVLLSEAEGLVVVVDSPTKVRTISPILEPHRVREQLYVAAFDGPKYSFGVYLDVETMLVNLRTMFEQTKEVDAIVKVLGNLTEEDIRTVVDDGFTQRVTAKVDVAKVGVVDMPNSWDIAPFRTFHEIAQPTTRFILRIRKGAKGGPEAALFEGDGGAWRARAVQDIRAWLVGKLPEDVKVVA